MTRADVALITGAAGSLGRVLAADLGAAGYALALVGSSEARLETLRDELIAADDAPAATDASRIVTVAADLRDAAAASAAVESVRARSGAIDVLVHLVGGWTGGTRILDATDEPFSSMLDQHLWTTLNVVRAVVPGMLEAGRGRVVAVSSPVAVTPEPGMAAYAVGKAALETLLLALAREVAGSGVTVNVVRVRSIDAEPRREGTEATPPGRTTPEEICAAIRYLLKDEAGVVNGQRIGLHGAR